MCAESVSHRCVAEFSFVPLERRARRSPVEETPLGDPSSVAATGGASSSSDAAVTLSRGFARDMSEITKIPDQELREMTDISDKKLNDTAGMNSFSNGGEVSTYKISK